MSKTEPTKPRELVVMSWAGGWGNGLWQAVSEPFSRLTGISVRHSINIGLKLPVNLTESLAGGQRPPYDIVWSNSVPAMRAALNGDCEPLDESTLPNLLELHPRARPDGFSAAWPLVSPYVVYYVLTYRRALFPNNPPASWEALLESRFKNKIALYPGGNGFYPIAQVMGGGKLNEIPERMEPCWQFLLKLKDQIGVLDYSVGMGEKFRKNELDLAFRALTNALAFQEEGLDVGWVAPREGITDTTDALWIPRHLPGNNAYWAKRYIDFALSLKVQERWCEKMGTMPMHREAATPPIFRSNPTLPQYAEDMRGVLHVPDATKLLQEAEWDSRFNRMFVE